MDSPSEQVSPDRWLCPSCGRICATKLERCPRCGTDQRGRSEDEVAAEDRQKRLRRLRPRNRRDRAHRLVDLLSATAPKYEDALRGERLASFSLIGTSDWEDYASLSFSAAAVELLADVDARLEQITIVLDQLTSLVAQVSERLPLPVEDSHT